MINWLKGQPIVIFRNVLVKWLIDWPTDTFSSSYNTLGHRMIDWHGVMSLKTQSLIERLTDKHTLTCHYFDRNTGTSLLAYWHMVYVLTTQQLTDTVSCLSKHNHWLRDEVADSNILIDHHFDWSPITSLNAHFPTGGLSCVLATQQLTGTLSGLSKHGKDWKTNWLTVTYSLVVALTENLANSCRHASLLIDWVTFWRRKTWLTQCHVSQNQFSEHTYWWRMNDRS